MFGEQKQTKYQNSEFSSKINKVTAISCSTEFQPRNWQNIRVARISLGARYTFFRIIFRKATDGSRAAHTPWRARPVHIGALWSPPRSPPAPPRPCEPRPAPPPTWCCLRPEARSPSLTTGEYFPKFFI